MACLDVEPDSLLHGLVGRDEGRTGRGPARTIKDPHLQAEPFGFVYRVLKEIPPLLAGILDRPLGNSLVRVPEGESTETNAFHVFQVPGDRLTCDVAIHPMPPGVRLAGVRWIRESGRQVIGQAARRQHRQTGDRQGLQVS